MRSSKPATFGNPGACVPSGTRTGDGPTIQHGTHAIGERVRLRRLRPSGPSAVSPSEQRELFTFFDDGTTERVLRNFDEQGGRVQRRKPTTFQNADRGGEVQFHLPTVAMPRHNVSSFYPNARHRPLRTPFLREAPIHRNIAANGGELRTHAGPVRQTDTSAIQRISFPFTS